MLVLRFRLERFLAPLILLFSLIPSITCTRNEPDKRAETPVLAAPPNTTFPMPPSRAKSINDMGWELADGEHNVLADFKGKVLVLDFYATWCAPCRDSVPHLVDMQRRYEKDGLKVVGLNVGGPDDLDKVSDFARELHIQYTLALPDQALISLLLSDSSDIPQTFVFDRKGQLVKRFIGYEAATGSEISQIVEKALQAPSD